MGFVSQIAKQGFGPAAKRDKQGLIKCTKARSAISSPPLIILLPNRCNEQHLMAADDPDGLELSLHMLQDGMHGEAQFNSVWAAGTDPWFVQEVWKMR